MPEDAKKPTADAGGGDGDGPADASSSFWDLRRAELEFWQRSQDAMLEHQQRATAALLEYQQTVKHVAEEVSTEQAAAFEAAAAETQDPELALERAAQIANDVRARIRTARQGADARLRAAGRSLAEAQQRSWLDALDKQYDAEVGYRQAVQQARERAFADSAAPPFAVAGDEGPAVVMPEVAIGPAWTAWFPNVGFAWPTY